MDEKEYIEKIIKEREKEKVKNMLIEEKNKRDMKNYNQQYISKKKLMTEYEGYLYFKLKKALNEKFIVFPQICVRSIAKTPYGINDKAIWKILDFVIFRYPTYEPVLIIELNGPSHWKKDKKERDKEVAQIAEKLKMPIWNINPVRDKMELDRRINWHIEQMIKMYPVLQK